MSSKLNPKLRAWSAAIKELGYKPPVKKGTLEYDAVKTKANQIYQEYVTSVSSVKIENKESIKKEE
jgi:hypothetical protein